MMRSSTSFSSMRWRHRRHAHVFSSDGKHGRAARATFAVRAARWLATAAIICIPCGCGYSTNGSSPVGGYQWHSLYPEDVKTIAVPIFTNKSFRRDEEFRLTKALVTQIEAKTQYKVVARERADTILEGEIESIDVRRVSDDPLTAVPQENLYVVVVNFTWKDQRTGRIRVSRTNFEQDSTFYPTLGEGEFVGSQQAAEKLATGIVEQLQADW